MGRQTWRDEEFAVGRPRLTLVATDGAHDAEATSAERGENADGERWIERFLGRVGAPAVLALTFALLVVAAAMLRHLWRRLTARARHRSADQ